MTWDTWGGGWGIAVITDIARIPPQKAKSGLSGDPGHRRDRKSQTLHRRGRRCHTDIEKPTPIWDTSCKPFRILIDGWGEGGRARSGDPVIGGSHVLGKAEPPTA